MEQEMRIAAEIQQALLPKAGHAGAFFRAAASSLPCRSIGGDFYDYVDLPDGAFGFALGDVAGKGPPAALLSAMMQGMFAAQAAASDTPSPDDRARQPRALPARHRVALRDADVRLARARRPADLLQRRPQPAARRRQAAACGASKCGGPIVGLFERATFEEETVTLGAGRLADRVQRRRVGGDVGRAARSTARSGSSTSRAEAHGVEPADDCSRRSSPTCASSPRGAPQSDDITALVLRYGRLSRA